MNAERLLNALGKLVDDPSVESLLEDLGLSAEAPGIRDGVSSDVEAIQHGVALFFRSAHHLRNVDGLNAPPGSAAVVSDIKFASLGFGGGPAYAKQLPYELTFTDTRAAVRGRLGEPHTTGMIGAIDRWHFGDRYLTIAFKRDGSRIGQVTCGLIWVL